MYFKKFSGAVFMFQKEVAEKIMAKNGDPLYGYFSALCYIKFKTSKLFDVSRYNFSPVPKVESTVIKIFPENKMNDSDFENYKRILRYSFLHKRKTIINSIFLSLKIDNINKNQNKDKEEIKKILEKAGINPDDRAENISPEKLMTLSFLLNK